MDVTEINTTLKLQRAEHRWWTKDERAIFQRKKEGWAIFSISDPIRKAFREYGIVSPIEVEPICFPTLKAAQQAVTDVSLEAGLNIDSRLTRQKYIAYKIGNLPLNIRREKGHWRVLNGHSAYLPPILKKHFNSMQEFHSAWYAIDSGLAPHPTRKAAHQAVINWLSQTVTVGK
jgi:hypothetical protein